MRTNVSYLAPCTYKYTIRSQEFCMVTLPFRYVTPLTRPSVGLYAVVYEVRVRSHAHFLTNKLH